MTTKESFSPAEQKARRNTRLLLLILVLLNIADALISQFIIANGYGYEGNQIMSYWVEKQEFVLIKAGGSLLAAILLWDLSRRAPKSILVITYVVVACYVAIVLWNVFVAGTATL